MMKLNPSIAIFISIILSSCTGQNIPVNLTRVENETAVISSTVATLGSELIFTGTPQAADLPPVNTPGVASGTTPVPTFSPDVSSSTPVADGDSLFIIPDTGPSQQPSINQDEADKFHNFSVPVSGPKGNLLLPVTGFPKDRVSFVGPQPSDRKYSSTDVTLEIPSLGVKIPIVGVPKKDGTWNVAWLGNEAGWLEGSAFPSWKGNSLLTGHVYLYNGKPGPFAKLIDLQYGEKVIVHAYGQKYTFVVQTNLAVKPNDSSVVKHEETPWLTLITCRDYDAKNDTYINRTVVRAALLSIDEE